ncbi:MAG: hypothetical protein IKO35_04555 [Elusimicrobiaceae bacterium]|nr:hypothetical protein [Elusimicrobiaceae bacterium]
MKKWLLFFIVFTALPLFAYQSLEVAYETSRYTYREPDGSSPISLKGRMQGGSIRYENRLNDSSYFFALDGRWMGGTTDYDGWLMTTPPTPHQSEDIGDYYYEGRLHLGGVTDLSGSLQLWYGSGLAYRYLKDHMNKDPYGYLRESNYIYVPFTGELRFKGGVWECNLRAELDYLLFGWQNSHMDTGNLRHEQHEGYGFRLSAKVQVNLDGRKTGIFVEPFYRFWDIQDSESNGHYMEPHNTTKEFGLRAGITF